MSTKRVDGTDEIVEITRENSGDDYEYFKDMLMELRFFAYRRGAYPNDSVASEWQEKYWHKLLLFAAEIMRQRDNAEAMVERIIRAGDIALDFPHVDDGIEAKATKDWMAARDEWRESKKK